MENDQNDILQHDFNSMLHVFGYCAQKCQFSKKTLEQDELVMQFPKRVGLTSSTLPIESRFSELQSYSLGRHYLVFSKRDPKNELRCVVWLLRGQGQCIYQEVKLFHINTHRKNILHLNSWTPLKNYQLFALFFSFFFFQYETEETLQNGF